MEDLAAIDGILQSMVGQIIEAKGAREVGEAMRGEVRPDFPGDTDGASVAQRRDGQAIVQQHRAEDADIERCVMGDKGVIPDEQEKLRPQDLECRCGPYISWPDMVDGDVDGTEIG